MSAPRSPSRGCNYKRVYTTYGGATAAAQATTRSNVLRGMASPDVHPYACEGCGWYHVGRRWQEAKV